MILAMLAGTYVHGSCLLQVMGKFISVHLLRNVQHHFGGFGRNLGFSKTDLLHRVIEATTRVLREPHALPRSHGEKGGTAMGSLKSIPELL